MITLTPQATRALERYLKRVRLSLRGTSVDAAEVERDVCEHINDALGDRKDPVADADLSEVLNRLGSPSQWVPEEEIPFWRQILSRLQHGPEDWRLAYLCFGLWFVGIVAVPLAGPLLWIPAYFMARAANSLAVAQGESLGPRKWLIYPPLVLFSAALLIVLLIGPLVPFVIWGLEESTFDMIGITHGKFKMFVEVAVQAALFGVAIGVWWMLLAPLSALARRPLRALLVPLADGYERKHAVRLGLLGLALVAVSLALLFMI